jgi:hypothetical protein
MEETRIYVGLRDKDSHEQIFDTGKYKDILKNVCRNYQTPFSLQVIEGGYFHEDGTWVDENTLLITLIGTPEETALEIARDVCMFFRQEAVMVTRTPVTQFTVQNSL